MFNKIKSLRKNLHNFQGKIDFVTYMSTLVLLVLHFIFIGFYLYENVLPMVIIDLIGITIYFYYSIKGIKEPYYFGLITYFCVLIHTVAAILCMGWTAGYYLWLYGLVCAFFLPSFGRLDKKSMNRPIIGGLLYVFIYYILGFLIPSGIIKPFYDISYRSVIILYGLNSSIVFFTIIAFTHFYTSRQKAKQDYLIHLADYDTLTNLKNRNAINREINERIKDKTNVFNVAILDIDLFKNVNDTYGHNAGDIVLKEVALNLKNLEGFGITCGRWGGEEFIILGPYDMSEKEFVDIMQDFRRNIKEHKFIYEKSVIKITISIGVSQFNKKMPIKKAIEKADKHLYRAKQTGRNKVVY